MAKFKRGDTVRLKSGGPLMTVTDAMYDDKIACEWFDKNEKREAGEFHADILEADDGRLSIA